MSNSNKKTKRRKTTKATHAKVPVNLYTVTIQTMAKDSLKDKNYQIVSMLEGILNTIDELFENPVFIDTIDGEQELRLDTFCEMLEAMVEQFNPLPEPAPFQPMVVDDSYDAD